MRTGVVQRPEALTLCAGGRAIPSPRSGAQLRLVQERNAAAVAVLPYVQRAGVAIARHDEKRRIEGFLCIYIGRKKHVSFVWFNMKRRVVSVGTKTATLMRGGKLLPGRDESVRVPYDEMRDEYEGVLASGGFSAYPVGNNIVG